MSGLGVELRHCSLVLGRRRVVQDVNLTLAPGDKCLLQGPNGAGKTQLVKLLAGLRWPTPTGRESRRWLDVRGREVHLVDAKPRIAYVGAESQDKYGRRGWNPTLEAVVATGIYGTDIPLDRPDAAARRRVARLLARFGLVALARRRMLEVSYGERRLALVARALAGRPRLLLLDEAYNGLDAVHRAALDRVLRRLLRTGLTLVLTAHRPQDAPPGIARVLRVQGGRVRQVASARPGPHATPAAARTAARPASRRPARAGEPLLQLDNVSVYRDDVPALAGLTWQVRCGEHWAITGRNGSGKSTLLGLLYGAYPAATGGRFLRRDHPPGTPLDEIRDRAALVSPELQADYDRHCTLLELVVSGLRNSVGLDSPPTAAETRRARRELARLGIAALEQRRAGEVSYGELRLALFARAFVRRPALLLLDEPFTGLDAGRRTQLRAALDALADAGVTLVVALHHRDDRPRSVNRELRLANGRSVRRMAKGQR